MAKARDGAVPAKQATKRRAVLNGAGETKAMPGLSSAASSSSAPVVHNVVLGGEAAGQSVNLLELLMEESGGGQPTTSMEAPGPLQSAGRTNADLTMPMAAFGSSKKAPGPAEFTAVLQAFRPAASVAGVPTQGDRPRVETGGANRAGEFTSLLEGLLDTPESGGGDGHSGIGHTQGMPLAAAQGTQVIASQDKPAREERPVQSPAAEPALSGALRTKVPESVAPAATASLPTWVPGLLVVIAAELLAILIVLLLGLKH